MQRWPRAPWNGAIFVPAIHPSRPLYVMIMIWPPCYIPAKATTSSCSRGFRRQVWAASKIGMLGTEDRHRNSPTTGLPKKAICGACATDEPFIIRTVQALAKRAPGRTRSTRRRGILIFTAAGTRSRPLDTRANSYGGQNGSGS